MRPLVSSIAFVLLGSVAHGQARSSDQQLADGRWPERARTPEEIAGGTQPALHPDDLRATAAAVLADLADGSTLKQGARKQAVQQATVWLRAQQNDDTGRVGGSSGADAGLAAYALASTYALSRYRSLKPVAWQAIGYLTRDLDDDVRLARASGSTCALLLLAAEMASAPVAGELRERMVQVLTARSAATRTPSLGDLAGELIGRLTRGAGRDQGELDRCAQLVIAFDLAGEGKSPPDELALLLATTALYRLGGAAWEAWSKKLTRLIATHPADTSSTSATALRAVTLSLYHRSGAVFGSPPTATDGPRGVTVIDDPILIEAPLLIEAPQRADPAKKK